MLIIQALMDAFRVYAFRVYIITKKWPLIVFFLTGAFSFAIVLAPVIYILIGHMKTSRSGEIIKNSEDVKRKS